MLECKAGIRISQEDNAGTVEGSKIDAATSQFSLSQIIKEPTNILSNLASFIDLIFTFQSNLIIHSGLHPSLHPNFYHEVVFAKFNPTIFYLRFTNDHSDTISKQILVLLNKPLNYLTRKKVFTILASINRFLLSTKRLRTSLKIYSVRNNHL